MANKQIRGASYFTLALGVLFMALAYFLGLMEGTPTSFVFALVGVAYVVRGGQMLRKSAQYPTPQGPSAQS